jgi:hypothetical protein
MDDRLFRIEANNFLADDTIAINDDVCRESIYAHGPAYRAVGIPALGPRHIFFGHELAPRAGKAGDEMRRKVAALW